MPKIPRRGKRLDYGVQTAMHVEFLCGIHDVSDIDNLMQFSDPNSVALALLKAELTIAGLDPLQVDEKHHDCVRHFNFKDAVDADGLREYKLQNAEVQMLNPGGKREIDRWFYEMGAPTGLVKFPALLKSMKLHGYSGWVVVESDPSPDVEESTMLNGWYLKQVLSRA